MPQSSREGPCTVVVYWDAPFTLEGVPILDYIVNIAIDDTGETVRKHVTDTRYSRSLGNNFIIRIAAVNGAGEGDMSLPLKIDMNNYAESFSVKVEMSRQNDLLKNWNLRIQLKVNIS